MTRRRTAHTRIRTARPEDVAAILTLIKALAHYERQPDAVVTREADLRAALFPETGAPAAFAHVAEVEWGLEGSAAAVPGRPVPGGFALWFPTFSTWTGKPGIWLEDLFVLPEHRGLGLGRALLATLATECRDRGYPRMDWSVLDWNTPSIGFYTALGAQALEDWTQFRLTGADLARLADQDEPRPAGEWQPPPVRSNY